MALLGVGGDQLHQFRSSVSARTWNPQPPDGCTSRHPSCLYCLSAMISSSGLELDW